MMEIFLSVIYLICLLFLFLFSLSQLYLTWIFWKNQQGKPFQKTELTHYPFVTIQLPVYNEKFVVERLLQSAASIDWPKDKYEIQVLDDSTDETSAILQKEAERYSKLGINIGLIHRDKREGFKAGALQNGLSSARGEFIAIFDADFIIPKDFLQRTIPFFSKPDVGVVQTRWGHTNENTSLLTRLQAFGLNAHFIIEQNARNASNGFINFNGTCGVWRKSCIHDAGGWSADTLTEDLDLSYRAQLKNWKFIYRGEVETPGELPPIMPLIKAQQYRWNKGGAETARKLITQVWHGKQTWNAKLLGTFHLLNSTVFVALLLAAITSLPLAMLNPALFHNTTVRALGFVLLAGFFSIAIFYFIAQRSHHGGMASFLFIFPSFLIVSMGLSLHNGLAVIEGWIGRKTPFIRTPKFNITSEADTKLDTAYYRPAISAITWLEGLLAIIFTTASIYALGSGQRYWLPFHAMLALGFIVVFLTSVYPVRHASK